MPAPLPQNLNGAESGNTGMLMSPVWAGIDSVPNAKSSLTKAAAINTIDYSTGNSIMFPV